MSAFPTGTDNPNGCGTVVGRRTGPRSSPLLTALSVRRSAGHVTAVAGPSRVRVRPMKRTLGVVAAASGALILVAGCSSPGRRGAPAPTTAPSAATPGSSSGPPVWLCRPGATPDPCVTNLGAVAVSASGSRIAQTSTPAPNSPFDCFYVYPTVSSEPGPNADLEIQPAESETAEVQAARFSSVCRVWAPMYRQVTLAALFTSGLPAINTAYTSLTSAWQYYLDHFNDGRPVIFIGHSQGAAMLIRLIANQVDPVPAVRARLVAAVLAGGNLQVPTGATVGATFKHIPLCTSATTAGCAIAFSTFGSPPAADSLFGRPGTGVSLQSLQLTSSGQQVACVNPAALAGGTGYLVPYFPRAAAVPWVTYPGLYNASCRSAEGATWLQVNTLKGPGDNRPVVTAALGPTWGYHADDVNLTLGNLVSDISALESAYRR